VFFQVPDAPKPVFGHGGAYDAPPDFYSAGQGTLWVFQLSVFPLKEAEARQTCPGFFLKSLLESPENFLIEFVGANFCYKFLDHVSPLLVLYIKTFFYLTISAAILNSKLFY